MDAANISGWFGGNAFYPLVFDTFNVIFYESGGNLVARQHVRHPGRGASDVRGRRGLLPTAEHRRRKQHRLGEHVQRSEQPGGLHRHIAPAWG